MKLLRDTILITLYALAAAVYRATVAIIVAITVAITVAAVAAVEVGFIARSLSATILAVM